MTGQANSIHEHRYRYRITSSSHIRTFKFYYRETPPFQPRVVRIYDRPTAEGPTLAPVPIVPDFPRNPDAKMPFLKPIIPTDRSFFEGKAQRRYDRSCVMERIERLTQKSIDFLRKALSANIALGVELVVSKEVSALPT